MGHRIRQKRSKSVEKTDMAGKKSAWKDPNRSERQIEK